MYAPKNVRFRAHALAASTLLFAAAGAIQKVNADQQVPPATVTHLPPVLTLKDAIAIALQNAPSGTIAQAGVDSAQGTREEAKSQYYPAVTPSYTFENQRSAEYGITQNQYSVSSINPGGGTTTTVQTTPGDAVDVVRGGGATISLKQTLIDSGQREVSNAEARHQLEAANFTDDDTRQQIISNVTSSYYTLLEAVDLVKVAQAQVTENQQTEALTQAELKAGTAATTDVYQAQANLATAQVTLIQDQNTVHVDSATLKNVLGIVTDDPIQLATLASGSDLPSPPVTATEESLDYFYKQAQDNRQDLRAQVATVDVDRDAVKLARINAGISLSADYLLTYQPDNDIGPKGTNSTFTLTGSFPLLDGGYSKGAVRIADANLKSAIATLEQTRENILEAVEQDYSTREESLQAISYAQVAVQAGQVNYNAAVASREAGIDTVLDITTAEATLTQAQSQYVTAIYNFYIADSNLQRAAGLL